MADKFPGQQTVENRPVAVLARALGQERDALRDRFIRRGVTTTGKSLKQLIAALTEEERQQFEDPLRKLLSDPDTSKKQAAMSKPTINVKAALVALYRASAAYGPVPLDKFGDDDVANGIADAIHYLGGTRG